MADITISDLELAPALADDMVFPVENTTDTYAATLAMLRRLINKTFVEVENANFNDLMDDGFYQCTGTPTNSPVAGAINWTLQVSAESGVVVQRAFSLDDNFANIYIRRWNGVTWTGWLEVGAGALANKANINLDNLSLTGQAKFDAKANVDLSNLSAAGQAVINSRANVDFSNATKPYVTETYHSGTTWHIVFSDGFKMQGGATGSLGVSASVTVSFSKPFAETNYFCCPSWSSMSYGGVGWTGRTTTGMTIQNAAGGATPIYWMACGY